MLAKSGRSATSIPSRRDKEALQRLRRVGMQNAGPCPFDKRPASDALGFLDYGYLPAVNHKRVAGYVAAEVARQKDRTVGNLFRFTHAAERYAL